MKKLLLLLSVSIALAQNYSLSFDGVDDYVNLTPIDLSSSDQMTLMCWINAEDIITDDENTIIRQDWGEPNWLLQITREGILSFGVENTSGTNFKVDFEVSASLMENSWRHVTGTYDGSNLKLYLDGSLIATQAFSGNLAFGGNNQSTYLNIGSHPAPNDAETFDGFIDEVSIWNIALSQSQIETYMATSLSGIETGLVGYWNFNEGTGAIAYDATSNDNDGTINGATWSTDVPVLGCTDPYAANYDSDATVDDGSCSGYPDNGEFALSFDGENDYISVASTESLSIQEELTISTWALPHSYTNSSNPRILQFGSNDDGYLLCYSGSGIQFKVEGMGSTTSSYRRPLYQWSHIVAIMSTDSLKIYENNNLITGIAISGGSLPDNIMDALYIGTKNGIHDLFDGQIFNLNIWNKALSNSEINQLYNRNGMPDEDNLVLSFRDFNEESESSVLDKSGNSNNGEVYGVTVDTNIPSVPTYTYVPDDNFEQALIDLGYDDVLDNYVYTENILNIEALDIAHKDITDLTGIEAFAALEVLGAWGNQLTSVDLTSNTLLKNAGLSDNQLVSINVSNNTSLEELFIINNQLSSLNVSNNPSLKRLSCQRNQLTSLDLTNNNVLENLDCHQNELTNLDVSTNPDLVTLVAYQNELISIDISNNPLVENLNIWGNQITTVDLSNNPNLKWLDINDMQVASLDVSANTNLLQLICDNNLLTGLDVSTNTALTHLQARSNQLTSIDVSNNTALSVLRLMDNQITALDVSTNTALTLLGVEDNQLTSLNVDNNTNLEELRLNYNQLTELDVTNNTAIERLEIASSNLTSLNVSANTALTWLDCNDNQLETLDVSNNIVLDYLHCNNNQITTLDLSANTVLSYLWCQSNQLNYLNIKNGVNSYFEFNTTNNPLACIETLNPDHASDNYTYENGNIDNGVTFEFICGSEARTNWHVSTTGSDISGSGILGSPLGNIQTAINASTDGDTVFVAPGTYYENIEIPNKKLHVMGQDRETTIIDGGGSSSVVNIWGADAGNDITLTGFTLQNGVGKPIDPGTHNNNNCGGGIVVANPASPLLTDLIIQNNAVNGAGGGIFVENGATLRLSNSIVRNNESGSGKNGGGIQMDGGTMGYIHNTEIYDNFAFNNGGGIFADSPLYITNSIIRNNRCLDGQGNGLAGRVYMYNCVVTQNGWESNLEFGYTGNHSMQVFQNSKIWNSIIWGNLGENKIGNNLNVSIDYSIVEGGLGGGIIDTQNIIWGSHNSSLNPQFNNPENYDFSPNPQTAGHVLNNGDPNQFFNNSDGTQNHIGHTGGVGIAVSPTELNFGNIAVGYDIAKSIDIINNTNSDLTISSINSSSSELDLAGWQSLPMSISPLGKTGIDLQILALSSGDISASAQLQFDHSVILDNNGFISVNATAYDLPSDDIIVPTDFSSIQLAIDIIPSNVEKTILVEPGEYFENIVLSGLNNVTIKSQSGPVQTIINGGGSGIVIEAVNNVGNITIEGFTFTEGKGGALDFETGLSTGVTLRNLIVTGNHGQGNNSRNAIVKVAPRNAIIENVVIADNENTYGEDIFDDSNAALLVRGISNDYGNAKIINTTIVNNSNSIGLVVRNYGSESANVLVLNSVIWGNGHNVYVVDEGSPYIYIDQSMVYDAPSIMDAGSLGTLTLNNCVDLYPYFSDPGNGDYTLSQYSPLISAGVMQGSLVPGLDIYLVAPSTDILGNLRPSPSGSNPDIGAYENSSSEIIYNPNKYVSVDGDNNNSGVITSSYRDIQHAIGQAQNGDIINVAPGTYFERIDFSGKNISVIGHSKESTIIDGGQAGSVVSFISGETHDAKLQGFTITNGLNSPMSGGIYVNQSSPTLHDLIISENTGAAGGGICIDNQCNVVMTNLIVRNNTATERGGGVYAWGNVTLSLSDSEISNNSAPHAGGVFLGYSIVPQIDNCTIAGNTATDYGGGVVFQNLLESDNVILTETNVAGNSAPVGSQLYVASYPNTWEEGNSPRTTISYSNIQQDNENDYFESDEGVVSWLGGNINVDPNFIDAEDSNYGILASSILVNSGNPDSIDSDGTRSDIGAIPYLNPYLGPVWYVTQDGDDVNGTGSSENPFASVQSAINFATTIGDSVTVAQGTYVENIDFRGRNIKVVGENAHNTILDGSARTSVVLFNQDEPSTTLLSDFTIQNGVDTNYPSGSGLSIKYADPTLKNLIVRGNTGGAGAISIHGPSQSIIQNVLVHENDTQGIFSWFSAPIIMNSTIVNNVYNGVYTYPGGSPTLVNSIITNNGENNVFLSEQSDSPGQVSIAYSMVGGGQEGVVLNNGTLDWGPGNINTDPQFLDVENDNYHLSDISPCIGSATPSITIGGTDYHSPVSDLDGSSRPNPSGTNPDMGAYESDRGVDPDYNGPVWYVDGSANLPYGNGGPGAPLNSIGGALESATDGDTILVSNGIYEEDVRFYSKAVALIGEDRDSTIISAGENGYAFYLDQAGKPNTLIRNFTITNGAVENSNAGLYITENSPDCKLENLNIVGNNGDGVYIAGFSSAKFTNCNISDNGLNGIVVWSESSVELVNTTLAKNGHYGIRMQGDLAPKSITVSNSIFYDNTSASIRSDNGITDIVNVAYTYSDDAFEQISSVVTFNSENLYDSSVNVKFVEEEVGNYHLVASSFLVNGGHPDSTDANGTRADLGAFPYDSPDLDTWYVSVAGNDTSGIGNAEFPLSSIQAALNLADNGDSIFVSGGTFQENLVVRGKNLVVSGAGEEETVIDANFSGTGIVVTGLEDFNFNFGSIENFKLHRASIVNGTGMQNWTSPDGDDTPFGGGAYVFQTSMAEFHNVSFSNNSAYGGGAIAAQDASVTLNNVIMHSNSSTYRGSAIWQLAGNIILTNSLIYKNSYVGDQSDFSNAASALAFGSGRYKLINNTIANNHGYPIHAYAQDPRVLLVNSILTWHDGQGSRPYFTPSDAVNVYLFNNFIKSGINIGGVFNENTNVFSTSNYYFEPSFVDTSSGNYRLSDQSVAISSGRNSIQEGFFNYPSGVEDFFFYEVTNTDLEGNDRINPPNSKVDIGAYENSNGVASYQNRKWNVSAERAFGNGSPDLPFPTINHAIDAISEFGGDTILVQDGTYHESIYTYGPNGYDYLTIKSVNGPTSTIIDAPNADQGNCLTVDGSNITVDGFTLTGGEGYQGAGGMIKESPTLKNLIVTDNHASHRGGGLLIHGSATLENVEIFNNTVSEEGTGAGGGLLVEILDNQNVATLNNVNIHNNQAAKGGGIYSIESSMELDNVSIVSNTASNGAGGGLFLVSGNILIKDTEIKSNLAYGDGGGIFEDHTGAASIIISGCIINANIAGTTGGGIALQVNGSTTIRRSIITNNQSGSWGSGIYVNHQINLSNSVISGNSGGRGMSFHSDHNHRIVNTIFNDNSSGNIMMDVYTQENQIQFEYNNMKDGHGVSFSDNNNGEISISNNNFIFDPLFIDPEAGDYHLLPDSRMIDTGHPDSLDIDGTRSDIGAFYYDQTGAPTKPLNLLATQSNSRILLSWEEPSVGNVAQYNVYRSFDVNENWYDATPHTTSTSPLYVEPNPDKDVTYIYRVSAVDADGDEGLIGFKAHCRIGLDDSSIQIVGLSGNAALSSPILPSDPYTLEGFFKLDAGESEEKVFGFPTEIDLKKSAVGDSIRLSLYKWNQFTGADYMIDTSSWHHLAFTPRNDSTIIWVDGYAAMGVDHLVNSNIFSVSDQSHSTTVDELRLSDIVRYTGGFIPTSDFDIDENTKGLWSMSEGSLDSDLPALYDLSGEGNHIELSEHSEGSNSSTYTADLPQRKDSQNALVINEIMPNPAGSDGGKEWFELYNGWFTPVHLKGWTLEGGTTAETHIVQSDVKIPSIGYGLFGQSSDFQTNGGYNPDYAYGTTISLRNLGEIITIKDGAGQIMDAVEYNDTFPYSQGISMELIRPDYDNSLADSWLAAGLPYGESGNMGTPGERNAAFSGTFLLASSALDYGYVTEGTETQLSFWIINDGVADLVIDSMMYQTSYFSLTPTEGLIPPGDSLEVLAVFSPEMVQVYVDTVTVFTDDPYNPTRQVALEGNAINQFADIVVNGAGNDSLSNYQFPFTRLGFSRTLNLDIVNIGAPDLEIEEIILEGDSEFSIDIDASILSFLDTLSMSVVYEPSEEGSNTATLIFGSNDPDEPSYTMSLFGQAAENIILFVPSEYPTIVAAIDSAYQQDTIEVAPGTYSGGLSLLDKNLVFRGGGDPNQTILQGDGTGPVLTIDGGQSALTKISNVTILGGGGTQGGGIKVDGGANPSFDHLIITANAVSGSGGGIAILNGSVSMSNMTIAYNSSSGNGGALYAPFGSSATLTNSILYGNGSTEIGSFGNVSTTYSIVSGGETGEGNMDVDPHFINGQALDFSLSWESLAIDAGDPDEFPDNDGTTLDLGALPYDQTLQPPDAVTSFTGLGGNGQIELQWGYPLDPRGNANGDIVDLVLMRAVDSGLFDTLAVLNDTDSMYTDIGQDGHLINGQEYHYTIVPRDTSNLESLTNDTLTIIPIGGTIALMDSDTTNDFGSVDHDQTSVWELLIENSGNGDLSLSSIEVSSTWYGVSESSMVIPAGETDTLLVTFDPDLTPGSLLDTIVINTDDLDAPVLEIELSGTGAWPVLALSDDELDHGDVRVDLLETLVLDISNNGTDTLFVDSIFVEDSLSGFSVAISEGRTSSRIAGILHPLFSKQDNNIVSVNQVAQDSTKSSDGRGGETVQGSRNSDTDPVDGFGTRLLSGGLMGSVHSGGGKSLTSGRNNNQSRIRLSIEVMPGESIGLDVSFTRSDTATVSTTLEITSDDPLGNGDLSIPLSGHSVAPVLSLSSESHLFGNVLDSTDYVFTITNTGTDTLNISEIDIPLAAFSQIWEGPTANVLEPGASGELTVTFSPELGGYYEENLTILSDTYLTGNSIIGLSGLKIPAQNIDFSGVLLGEDSVQVLSFENNGNIDLTIATISVESSSDFSTDISTNLVLPVDAAGQLNVTFQPSARGPATGNIIFTTPASPNEIVAVSATGEGWIPPTAEFAATSISVVTYQGNDLSFDLEVINSGDYPLNYASSVSANFAGWVWLETVSTGQILGTTDSTILVNVVNTANLDPGIYNGNIYFDTNTGENPSELVSGTHVMDIFLNLLGDDSQITDTTVTIPSGNTPPITFADDDGQSIGLVLDFVNSAGGTVTVQGVSTLPPVDENTPFVDPDGLLTDPVYPAQYYEISTDIEGNFVTDIKLSYSILPGIDSPNTLRLAKRPGNSGTSEPWQLIAVADTEVDTVTGQVVAKNQSSFSQWALISNSTENSFMDTKGPAATSLSLNPEEPGVLVDALVSVNVSDDTGIESVTLYYAPGGSDTYASTGMVNDGQGTYSGTIPGSSVTQSGLLYYVMSQDVLGFSSSSDTLGASVNFASGTLTTNSASGSAYPTGLPMDAWRLISTPAILNETGLTQVFDELGTQDNTVWRVFRYDDVSNTYKDNPVDLNSTESYWIYQKTEDNLTMDTPAGKTGNMSGTEITLKTGWNFIGSPYPFQIPLQLDQVQFYGPLTYGISGESWSPVVTELDPWNGYVVYNRMSTDQILNLDPSIEPGTTAARKVEENGWLMSLDLSSGTHGDHINTLGALETAEDALEWHDNPEIRSPGTGVSLFFKLEEETLELTSDIRSLDQQVNIWDMYVRSDTDSDVDLSWSVIQDLPADVDIRLVDLATRKVINMKSETQLFFGTLDPRYDRRVKIVAGDESEVAARIGDVLSMIPEELSISGNYPNPFNPSTTIRYGLPEPRNVRMTIVNIKGQQIAELISGWQDMGRHEVIWNGRNDDGSSLSSGIYFVIINDGTSFKTHKVMLLK